MDEKKVLSELGLSEGEIKVYLALLKLGVSTVSNITKITEQHRTTIYDFLEKLLDKGLVNYTIQNNVKYYKATHPSRILDVLKEKEDHVRQIMPKLEGLFKSNKEEVKVEVYKGKEGLKSVLLDAFKTNDDIIGIGMDDSLYKKELPIFTEQFQRMLKEHNKHERIITKVNPEYLFDQSNTHYKFISSEFFSPISTVVFGNKVQIVLWEPQLTTLLINNKKLADAYKKHFEVLWDQKSNIFRGDDEILALFDSIVDETPDGGEYYAFGVPPLTKKWTDMSENFVQKMEKKGVKEKVIIDESSKGLINMTGKYPGLKIRIMPKENMTPAEVDVYGDKVAIILWAKVPQAFVIENKEIAKSFKKYFDIMWKVAKN